MQIYGLQFDMAWEQPEENFARSRRLLEQAEIPPGSLIILPEMYATGFSMRAHELVTRELVLADLKAKARQFKSIVIGGGVDVAPGGKGRNIALTCSPEGELIHEYAKIFTFTYGGESKFYQPGTGFSLLEMGEFKAAVFICYDLRFPELFREAVKAGANLFIIIASWPGVRREHWRALLIARAIENQAYVAGINRCGQDPQVAYTGDSLLVDPRGKLEADGQDREGVIAFTPDLEALSAYRKSFPTLEDMNRSFTLTC